MPATTLETDITSFRRRKLDFIRQEVELYASEDSEKWKEEYREAGRCHYLGTLVEELNSCSLVEHPLPHIPDSHEWLRLSVELELMKIWLGVADTFDELVREFEAEGHAIDGAALMRETILKTRDAVRQRPQSASRLPRALEDVSTPEDFDRLFRIATDPTAEGHLRWPADDIPTVRHGR